MKIKNNLYLKIFFCILLVLIIMFTLKTMQFVKSWTTNYYKIISENNNNDALNTLNTSINQLNLAMSKNRPVIDDELSNYTITLNFNGQPTILNLQYNNDIISALSLNAEHENTLQFSLPNSDLQIYFDNNLIENGHNFYLDKLDKELLIPIEVRKNNLTRTYYLQTLPEIFPNIELSGSSAIDGDYYSNYMDIGEGSFIYKMNNAGDILYYFGSNYGKVGSVMNFQKHIINGETFYSFFEPVIGNYITQTNISFGKINILDYKYKLIDSLTLMPTDSVPNANFTENHEFLFLDQNHYVLSGAVNVPQYIESSGVFTTVKAAYIQELKDGKVLFEWLSSSDQELYMQSTEGNDWSNSVMSFADYAHINSIDIDPVDDNFVISMRNIDSIIKIDRKTGGTVWRLGGTSDDFNLTESQLFSKQHYAKFLPDGSLLFFDNGNRNQQTRIIRFWLDQEKKEVIKDNIYQIDGKWSPACGSVQCIDLDKEIYLIGWGMNPNSWTKATEIDLKNNKINFEIISDKNLSNYRFLKFQ